MLNKNTFSPMSLLKTIIKMILGKGVFKSYSISGEDLIILPFFHGKKGAGFYVDVGCYHPMLYSNTYRLYRQGWKGIVIDPNPGLKKLFALFRPRDTFVQTAVGAQQEMRTYFQFKDESYNTLDSHSAERYKQKTTLTGTYPVEIRSLRDVLQGVTEIDLLNVDVEGLDLEVLQSCDWKVKPRVIIVEARPESPVSVFLEERGYKLVGLTKLNSIFAL
jgi:FkbM family methyltransferase